MRELERKLVSKSGSDSGGEDALLSTDDFACVVDGATSQTQRLWGTQTGGQMAAQQICRAVASFPPGIDAVAAVERLTAAIERVYRERGCYAHVLNNPADRATAVVAIYSRCRREVWRVGDCQCLMVSGKGRITEIKNPMRVDAITTAARAPFLAAELEPYKSDPEALSKRIAELREHDSGRDFIAPLLRKQQCFRNSPGSEYSYWVIDGFPIPPSAIKVVPVPGDTDVLVLASDGYPKLLPTCDESERLLRQILKNDPLLIGEHKATKTVKGDNESYDDRVYLRLQLS